MNVGIYVRVSTIEQAMEGYSIGEQTDRLQKYADAMNWNVYRVYTDAGFTGSNMKRPALQQLIADVKLHKINAVLVYKLDRLSRSQKDTLELIENIFMNNNVDFISITENFDTSSALGRAMIGIIAVFAELERQNIKERMMLGRIARAKNGSYSAGNPPIGYDYINGELIPNEYESFQVKRIFELFASGESTRSIAQKLNDAGYKTKYGAWNHDSIHVILKKQTYIGKILFQGEWYDGFHQPIIDLDLWNSVQTVLKEKSEFYNTKNRLRGNVNSYLGGICVCGNCGAKYMKVTDHTTKKGKKYKYYLYKCGSRSKKSKTVIDPNCKNKIWKMDELDQIVFDQIRQLKLQPIDQPTPVHDNSAVLKHIKKIDDQINKLLDLYAIDGIPLQSLESKIQSLNDEREQLEQTLVEDPEPLNVDRINNMIQSFDDVLNHASFDQTRLVIETLIDKIVLTGDNVEIHWNF